jgi:hypothetical protein
MKGSLCTLSKRGEREREGGEKSIEAPPFVCRRHAHHFLKDLDALLQTLPQKVVFDWGGHALP